MRVGVSGPGRLRLRRRRRAAGGRRCPAARLGLALGRRPLHRRARALAHRHRHWRGRHHRKERFQVCTRLRQPSCAQRRGGRGKRAAATKENDWIDQLFTANTHDFLLCFSDRGRLYWLKVWEVPAGSRGSRGRPIVNMFPLQEGEKINVVLALTGERSLAERFPAFRRRVEAGIGKRFDDVGDGADSPPCVPASAANAFVGSRSCVGPGVSGRRRPGNDMALPFPVVIRTTIVMHFLH